MSVSPVLVGNSVFLRVLSPEDYPKIYLAETGSTLGDRWRMRGRTPSFSEFCSSLTLGVASQYGICDTRNADLVAYATVSDLNLDNRHAYFSVTKLNETGGSHAIQGSLLMLAHAFAVFDLRKMYAVVSEFNLSAFGSGIGRLLKEEGRLVDHELWRGRYWDRIFLAIYREDLVETIGRFRRLIGIPAIEGLG